MTIKALVLAAAIAAALNAGASERKRLDFDGDARADIAVYHAAAGTWYVLRSSDNQMQSAYWGWNQAQPVPGDYDGDGRADYAVYNSHSGWWFLLKSGDASMEFYPWGGPTMGPVMGDFDGDGRSDFAVYERSSGIWCIAPSSGAEPIVCQWGGANMTPAPGDFDGDGRSDLCVYDQAAGLWHVLASSSGAYIPCYFGWYEAEPVSADYDGDGRTDLAVYHPAAGAWYILSSSDGGVWTVPWGWAAAQPAPGDYDGDGRADLAVYSPHYAAWFVLRSSDLGTDIYSWGGAYSEPVEIACRQLHPDYPRYAHSYGHDYEPEPVVPADFSGVEWLYPDVSGWAQTSVLAPISLSATKITLDYDKANAWPAVTVDGVAVVANAWIFVPKQGGGWYAATFEWLRPGQTTKFRYTINGDHIKRPPLQNFTPVPGEWYGFMVSGLCRSSARNVYERTNVVMFQWPAN